MSFPVPGAACGPGLPHQLRTLISVYQFWTAVMLLGGSVTSTVSEAASHAERFTTLDVYLHQLFASQASKAFALCHR
jgi:hypothetical protein